jgi:aspartate-semialdehyde dehydrogenase
MMNIAIVGATGAVGRCMIAEARRSFPKANLHLFASARSDGQLMEHDGESFRVQAFAVDKLKDMAFVLMSAGGAFSKEFSPKIVAEHPCVVIDNSSAFRMEKPLIVPEVNMASLDLSQDRLIANPNCSTIQLVCALKPLDDAFGLESVNVATYQSASGAGQKGLDILAERIQNDPPIKDNVVCAIDRLSEDGHCYEEIKMILETRKILARSDLEVFATTARVPVPFVHSEAVSVRLKREVSRDEVKKILESAPALKLHETTEHKNLPKNSDYIGKRTVGIARLRLPYQESKSKLVQFWCLADNLYKGAASNAVQIMERLV